MQFYAKTIKKQAEKNFEKTWLETADLLKTRGRSVLWKKSTGKKHPLHELNKYDPLKKQYYREVLDTIHF